MRVLLFLSAAMATLAVAIPVAPNTPIEAPEEKRVSNPDFLIYHEWQKLEANQWWVK